MDAYEGVTHALRTSEYRDRAVRLPETLAVPSPSYFYPFGFVLYYLYKNVARAGTIPVDSTGHAESLAGLAERADI